MGKNGVKIAKIGVGGGFVFPEGQTTWLELIDVNEDVCGQRVSFLQ